MERWKSAALVEVFVVQALNHFAESRLLDVSGFFETFLDMIKLRWSGGSRGPFILAAA